MTYVTTSQLVTQPQAIQYGSFETMITEAPSVDMTAIIDAYPAGTIPTVPVVVCVPLPGLSPAVTLAEAPSVVGNIIVQPILEGELASGTTYRMTVKFTPSGTTDIRGAVVNIVCQY